MMKKTLCYLLVLTILLTLSACGGKQGDTSSTPAEDTTTTVTTASTTTTTTAKPTTTTTTVKPTNKTKKTTTKPLTPVTIPNPFAQQVTDEPIPAFDGTLTVYQIGQMKFQCFIENPSYAWFKDRAKYHLEEEGTFIKTNGLVHEVSRELINFVGNKNVIEEALSKVGITEQVLGAIYFEAVEVPITIWIKTEKRNLFIVPNAKGNGDLFSQDEYYKAYRVHEGRLIVKGNDITGLAPMNIYHDFALLPMMTVFEAMGAKIKQQNEWEYIIVYGENTYILNLKNVTFFRKGYEEDYANLFNPDPGNSYIIYPLENEIMLGDRTLYEYFQLMGMDGTIIVDYDNAQVLVM